MTSLYLVNNLLDENSAIFLFSSKIVSVVIIEAVTTEHIFL